MNGMSLKLPPDNPGPHSAEGAVRAGTPLESADSALILIHGRGAPAESILEIAEYLDVDGFHLVAPQAQRSTWYPYSFLESMNRNEPGISSGLATIDSLVVSLIENKVDVSRIFILGFSQGACLATEYAARAAERRYSRAASGEVSGTRFGGIFGLSGGLIGPPGIARDYGGSLDGTPVFLGCSDMDMHIPKERVDETAEALSALGANVDKQIYPGMGHTVNNDELERINTILRSSVKS